MIDRKQSEHVMITATIEAMRQKLESNDWKPPITELSLAEALLRMKEELIELSEELSAADLNYHRIRWELADVANFAGAAIVACDREIFKESLA